MAGPIRSNGRDDLGRMKDMGGESCICRSGSQSLLKVTGDAYGRFDSAAMLGSRAGL